MKKYIVTLTEEERAELTALVQKGKAAARKLTHARILRHADERDGAGWRDEAISAALAVSTGTVQRIRQLFVEEGLRAALDRRPWAQPRPWKLDGAGEAHLLALACSTPPDGQARWTLRLLAEEMVALEYVETLSYETVRQVLK
jgi:hypothetical protein